MTARAEAASTESRGVLLQGQNAAIGANMKSRGDVRLNTSYWLIVGDIYGDFAEHERVMTATRCKHYLDTTSLRSDERFILGQGVGASDADEIRAKLRSSGHPDALYDFDELAPISLTHKQTDRHVLISCLRNVGPRAYQSQLVLDDASDRLCDHVTGQHLAGMVLIEASRQAALGVLECEYKNTSQISWGLTWSSTQVQFLGYIFPVPLTLTAKVSEPVGTRSESRIPVNVVVDWDQLGKPVCEMALTGILLERAFLAKLEVKRARQAVDALWAKYGHDSGLDEPRSQVNVGIDVAR